MPPGMETADSLAQTKQADDYWAKQKQAPGSYTSGLELENVDDDAIQDQRQNRKCGRTTEHTSFMGDP